MKNLIVFPGSQIDVPTSREMDVRICENCRSVRELFVFISAAELTVHVKLAGTAVTTLILVELEW